MNRNRYDQDDVVNTFYENFRRAGITLLLSAGFFVAWLTAWGIAPESPSQIGADFNALARTVFGWGATIFFGTSMAQYAYAFFYPRFVAPRH